MQIKIIAAAMGFMATVSTTSAFALGFGLQIGADLDTAVQTSTRSVTSITPGVPTQIQLHALGSPSVRTSTNSDVITNSHTTEHMKPAGRTPSATITDATIFKNVTPVKASRNEKVDWAKKNTAADAKATFDTAVHGRHKILPQAGVGFGASTKARVSGF